MEKCTNEYCNVCQRTALQEVYFSQYHSPNIIIVPTVSFESGPPAKKIKLDNFNEEIPINILHIRPEEPSTSCIDLEIPSSIKSCDIDIKTAKDPNDLQSNGHQQGKVNLNLKDTNDKADVSSNIEINYNNDTVLETVKNIENHPLLSEKSLEVATDDDKRVKTLLSSILSHNDATQCDGVSKTKKNKENYTSLLNNLSSVEKINQRKCEKPNISKCQSLKTKFKEGTHSSSNSKKIRSKPTPKMSTIKKSCLKCKTPIVNSNNEKSCMRNKQNALKESKRDTLISKQHNKSKDSMTSKNPINTKANTQTTTSTSPMKSVVHITENYDLKGPRGKFYRNKLNKDDIEREDLRKRLSTPRNKRDNLIVTVPNNSKITKKYTRSASKVPQKKIKLIINVICQKPEGKRIKAEISDQSPLHTSVDVSFLDDFDVDDIVKSLNFGRKEIHNKLDDVDTSNIESEVKFGMNLVKTEELEDSFSSVRFPCQESKQFLNYDVDNTENQFKLSRVKEEVCEVKPCNFEEKKLISIKPHESVVSVANNLITPETVSEKTQIDKDLKVVEDIIKKETNMPDQDKESNLKKPHAILDIKVTDMDKDKLLSNLSNRNMSVKEKETKSTIKSLSDDKSSKLSNGDTKTHHCHEIIDTNDDSYNKVKDIKNTGGDQLLNDNTVNSPTSSVLMKIYKESKESFNTDICPLHNVDVENNDNIVDKETTIIIESNESLSRFSKPVRCLIESCNDNMSSLNLNNNSDEKCFTTMKNSEDTEITKSNNVKVNVLSNHNDVPKSTETNSKKICEANIVCTEANNKINNETSKKDYESNRHKIEPETTYEINQNNNSLGLKQDNDNVTKPVINLLVGDLKIKETQDQITTFESHGNDGKKLRKPINNNKTGLNTECTNNPMKKKSSGESNRGDNKLNNYSTKDMNNKKNTLAPIHSPNLHDYVADMKNKRVVEGNLKMKIKKISQNYLVTSHPNCDKDISKPSAENKKDNLLEGKVTNKIAESIYDNSEKTLSFETKHQMQIRNDLRVRIKEYLGLDYEICALIHSGKYSYIYSCKDPNGKILAAKVSRADENTWIGINKELMLHQLQKSVPRENFNFVYFINGFAISRHWCFLTEYYPRNLAELLAETRKGFHINDVQRLSRQLISAVLVLRHNNIVHSDIKPGHILLNNSLDRLKLCGFDAMRYHDDRFQVLPNIGNTKYRAPEIILGFSASYSIDVWSTALVMYEMATALPLFSGPFNNNILYEQMSLFGNLPQVMIHASPYKNRHFLGKYFMRRFGSHGQCIHYISNFTKSNKLAASVYNKHQLGWATTRSKRETKIDEAKLHLFLHLLQQMLVLHPNARLPIEFAFADTFIYEAFN